MDIDDPYWHRTDEEMLRDFYDWTSPALEGITLDKRKEVGFMRLKVGLPHERAPHAACNFKTASGNSEFKSSLAEGGDFVVSVWRSMYEAMQPDELVDPLPDYIPPYESMASNPELGARYPLAIVSPSADGSYGRRPKAAL